MEGLKCINIIKYLSIKKYWRYESSDLSAYMSHHSNLNSPYETYDSCGNCDGARCEGCREIKSKGRFECIADSCKVKELVLKELTLIFKVPTEEAEDIASELVYSDKPIFSYKGFRLLYPKEHMLSKKFVESLYSKNNKYYKFLEERYNPLYKKQVYFSMLKDKFPDTSITTLSSEYNFWVENRE